MWGHHRNNIVPVRKGSCLFNANRTLKYEIKKNRIEWTIPCQPFLAVSARGDERRWNLFVPIVVHYTYQLLLPYLGVWSHKLRVYPISLNHASSIWISSSDGTIFLWLCLLVVEYVVSFPLKKLYNGSTKENNFSQKWQKEFYYRTTILINF